LPTYRAPQAILQSSSTTLLTPQDARRLIGQYVTHCKVSLHGAIGFVAPQEMLAGRQPQISPHRPQTRRPTLSSANSAASRLIKNHSSNHDARYNDFAK
jgi:hypothetical protein